MTPPQLYVFAISHYCEKARWALDYLGVEYEINYLAPGLHAERMTSLGANDTSLPVLVNGDELIQGSSDIISWAESAPNNGRTLDCERSSLINDITNRIDDVLGVHVRRMYYSEALVEHPETVLPIFADYLDDKEAALLREIWKFVVPSMIEKMELGADQGRESRAIVLQQLDWFDELLEDDRDYLLGDTFTRVDLSAASILAPLAMAPEHPTYGNLEMPPRIAQDVVEWQSRPVSQFVARVYRRHRNG
ncbi:MAG: glutathione S-transferase [Alcanivorax sp.]|jgi:glutathione S-transferase